MKFTLRVDLSKVNMAGLAKALHATADLLDRASTYEGLQVRELSEGVHDTVKVNGHTVGTWEVTN